MDALIVVDVQNDFCPGGALAVPDGDAVIKPLGGLQRQIGFTVATRDWHPPDHQSFREQGGPWPVHCVRETTGAQLHADLGPVDAVVDKGAARDLEGYSGFEATDLERILRERGVTTVHIGGLALDYCVRATALEARRRGFEVVLHTGATRPIGDPQPVLDELREAGVQLVD